MTPEEIKSQVTARLKTLAHVADGKPTQTTTQPSGEAPRVSKEQKPALYELDRYVKFRDPIMFVGIGVFLIGIGQFSIPLELIIGGVIVVGISWMMAR